MMEPFKLAASHAPRRLGVNRQAGTIAGLSLLTANVEAKGHGIFIDAQTLSTALDVVTQRGGKLKAAIKHRSLIEQMRGELDRIAEFPGWFSGLSIAGGHLVAGKLEFYDDFKTGEDTKRLFNRLLEMAEKTPDLFGLSIEAWGYAVFVGEDGTEYSERPNDIALKYEGLPALRVTDLTYAAFVDEPAANPKGLFAKFTAQHPQLAKLIEKLAAIFRATEPSPQPLPPPQPGPALFAGKQNPPRTNPSPTMTSPRPCLGKIQDVKYSHIGYFSLAFVRFG